MEAEVKKDESKEMYEAVKKFATFLEGVLSVSDNQELTLFNGLLSALLSGANHSKIILTGKDFAPYLEAEKKSHKKDK